MQGHVFSIVMPRFKRGIQYAVTSRASDNRLWNTLDRPVRPGDDISICCLKFESGKAGALLHARVRGVTVWSLRPKILHPLNHLLDMRDRGFRQDAVAEL